MSLPRLLATALLAGGLLIPATPVMAQGQMVDGWVASDDGHAFATSDSAAILPGWQILAPDQFPPGIADIRGPQMLYRIEGTDDAGARIVTLLDGTALPWLEAGRTPVLAKAVVDDDGAAWLSQQHVISFPAGCADAAQAMGDCVHARVAQDLLDLAAPLGTPSGPPPVAEALVAGTILSGGTAPRDGTVFSFAGDATVGTTMRIRDDDTIVVRGDAVIGDGLGGRLLGFDAAIVGIPTPGSEPQWPPGWGPLQTRAVAVRDAGATQDGPNRRVLRCPSSRRGYVVSQFLVSGMASTVGPVVDPGLAGGVPVLVSEIIPFDCGPAAVSDGLAAGPGDGAFASFVCGSARPLHELFTSEQNGRTVTNSSSVAQRYAVATVGVPPEAPAMLQVLVGDANGDELFTVDLQGVPLDSATHPDATLWLGESRVGIDTYGSKPFRQLQLTVGPDNFDLLEQQRSQLGKAIEVGRGQKEVSSCPGFDFGREGLANLFPAGFDTDEAAWQAASPD